MRDARGAGNWVAAGRPADQVARILNAFRISKQKIARSTVQKSRMSRHSYLKIPLY